MPDSPKPCDPEAADASGAEPITVSALPWDASSPDTRPSGPDFDTVLADLSALAERNPDARLYEVQIGDLPVVVYPHDLNSPEEVERALRVRANRVFLHGCCWHFTLVGHRLTGLDAVRVLNAKGAVLHAALALPDGRFFDSRGIVSEGHLYAAIGDGTRNGGACATEPFPVHELAGLVKPDREEVRPFLAETEAWFRLLASMEDYPLIVEPNPADGANEPDDGPRYAP